VSKEYNSEIGYESLLSDFKRYQKQTPKGLGLTKKGQGIYLQFKTPSTSRKQYACGCNFTLDGMVDALSKAHKVAEKLKSLKSEVEFWQWYDKEIKQESQLVDDRLTFGEAIAIVEADFWSRLSRTKNKRDKDSPSDINSYRETYGKFYKHLPLDKLLTQQGIQVVIDKYKKGTRTYRYVVSAMKKLALMNHRRDIHDKLSQLDIAQTEFNELQTLSLEDFLAWRSKVLGIGVTLDRRCKIESRKAWIWVFSVQIVYGLRLSEVFAIKNLTEPYTTKDGVSIPALNNPENTDNLIYIGDKTTIGTKVKTGKRIARPQIPPKYPDLIERLDVKESLLPLSKPKSKNPESLVKFFSKEARTRLLRWDAPFTQTHADRHLGNINGIQAGIPLEIRAQSMGHTPAMNDSVYKKRQSTQTTIDLLLNSNQNAIDFVTALASVKNLVKAHPDKKDFAAQILSIIYQKNQSEIYELLA
jgi:hypothetical protein